MTQATAPTRSTGRIVRSVSAVLGVLLLLSLVPVMRAYGAEAVTIQITPEINGDTAVRAGNRVVVSGTAPAGSRISMARFVPIDPDGNEIPDPIGYGSVPDGDLNKLGVRLGDVGVATDYIRVNELGQLEGQLELRCLFAAREGNSCAPAQTVRFVKLELRLQGSTTPHQSNSEDVDYTRPVIASYDVIATDPTLNNSKIRVNFSEPVRQAGGQPDLASEWTVSGREVVAIEGSGQSRILTVVDALHEDAKPAVDYNIATAPERKGYEDFASNQNLTLNASMIAMDLVRPAAPAITAVDGKAPSSGAVTSKTPAPVVSVGNLTTGHEAIINISGGGLTEQVVQTADAASINIALPTLRPETPGTAFTITAVARDPHCDDVPESERTPRMHCEGNRSSDASKSAPRADGSPVTVTYNLDTVAPVIQSAAQTALKEVVVQLSENVTPDASAGEWRVGDQVATASGTGKARTLRVEQPVASDVLSWQPSATAYSDAAGNQVSAAQVKILTLREVLTPVVSAPTGVRYYRAATLPVTVSGTVEKTAERVNLRRSGQGAGVGGDATVSDGTWSVSVGSQELGGEGRHSLEAVASRGEIVSHAAPVSDIVIDTTAPKATIHEPAHPLPIDAAELRPEYRLGQKVGISYSAEDPATGDSVRPDHVERVELAVLANGQRRVLNGDVPAGSERSAEYTVSESELDGRDVVESAQFEIKAIDAAGNVTTTLSDPVRLVRPLQALPYEALRERAAPSDPAYIDVTFPAPVTGSTSSADWRVDGLAPMKATLMSNGRVVRLENPRVPGSQHYDPNARPNVQYAPLTAATHLKHRTATGGVRDVTTDAVQSIDKIAPVLTAAPDHRGPSRSQAVAIRGTSDASSSPNTIRVWKVDADGNPIGSSVQTIQTKADGTYALDSVALPNAVSNYRARAIDPSGNASTVQSFTYRHDSIKPAVAVRAPRDGARVSREGVVITWSTTDPNFDHVRITYRVNDGEWYQLADRTKPAGTIIWNPWNERVRVRDGLDIRVVAIDRAGNWSSDWANNLFVVPAERVKPTIKVWGPADRSRVSRERVRISWTARDTHFDRVRISYRVNDGRWYHLPQRRQARGVLRWNPWNKVVRVGDRLDIRVTAYDIGNNWKSDWANNLYVTR